MAKSKEPGPPSEKATKLPHIPLGEQLGGPTGGSLQPRSLQAPPTSPSGGASGGAERKIGVSKAFSSRSTSEGGGAAERGGPAAPLKLTAMYDIRICDVSLLTLLPIFAGLLAVVHLAGGILYIADHLRQKRCWVDRNRGLGGLFEATLVFQFLSPIGLAVVVMGSLAGMRRLTVVGIYITTVVGFILLILHAIMVAAFGLQMNAVKEARAKGDLECENHERIKDYLIPEVVFFVLDMCIYPLFVFVACETSNAYGYHPEDEDDAKPEYSPTPKEVSVVY